MPPTEPKRRAGTSERDEVGEYFLARRRERARRSARALGQDVLSADAEFTWEMPPDTALRARSLDDGVDFGVVLESTVDDAWRAAAAARHAVPRAVEQSLDEWGDRIAEPNLRPVVAPRPRSNSRFHGEREAAGPWASAPAPVAAPSMDDHLDSSFAVHAYRSPAGTAARVAAPGFAHAAPVAAGFAHARAGEVAHVPAGEVVRVPAGEVVRAPASSAGMSGRRTVVITGRGAERYPVPRRSYSASLRPYERAGFKPDRVALWAVVLCLALLLGAVASSH